MSAELAHTQATGDGKKKAERNQLVDALRFLAIEMVVLQHILNLRWEFKPLPGAEVAVKTMLSFNMPLFVFLSGYVLLGREGKSTWSFIRGKALALLVPYVAWMLVVMPLRHLPLSEWLPRILAALVNPYLGFQMWFLQVLFCAMVVFALIRRVSQSQVFLGVSGAIVAFLPVLTGPVNNLYSRFCWLYPFLVMGYLVARNRERLSRWEPAGAAAGVVGFPLLIVSGYHGHGYLFAAGTLGSLALWGTVRNAPAVLQRGLGWLGQRTLGVYGWQMVVMPFLVLGALWPGALASWALVSSVSIVLTLVLEHFGVTRALFLGRWPKRSALIAAPIAT